MPKKVLKLTKFEGGVNTASSERALLESQSPLATNADTTSLGALRTMGNAKSNNLAFYDPTGVADPGYGLFTFSHDYDMLTTANGSFKTPADTPTTYLCKATTTGIAIYDYTNEVWYDSNGALGVTDIITFDDNQSNILPIFYVVDGALRVCDSAHPWEKVKWLGFINRNLFDSSGTPIALKEWYSTNANIWGGIPIDTAGTPISNIGWVNAGETLWPSNSAGNADKHIKIYTAWDHTDAELATFSTGRTYHIHISGLFDDSKQEGEMIEVGTGIGAPSTTDTGFLKLGVSITPGSTFGNFNHRLRGFRLYIQDSLDTFGQIYQMLEVDFVRGCKKAGSPGKYEAWDLHSGVYWSQESLGYGNCFVFEDMPVGNTYDSQNGHYSSEETKAGFNAATVVGRRVYIGGVTPQEGTSHASGVTMGDTMLKTPGNAFDKFPAFNRVEAVTNDGDDIVALENFGGKILQFKRRSLYVIALSGDLEVLEAQHKHVGITKPYHVVATTIGVFWINKIGLHWYSPEGKITNLIEDKLSLKTWDFSDFSSIGYDALNKKLIIAKDVRVDSATTGYKSKDVIVFDMRNMSFMFGMDTIDGGAKSNFSNAPDGKLIYSVDGSNVGYAKLDLSAKDLTYNFYGTLVKYNTSYGDSKWELETYPQQLLGSSFSKGMDPLGAQERTAVVWDDTKHTIAASAASWLDYAGSAIELTTVFDKGERYDVVDSLITTPDVRPSGMNRTWMRNNADNTGESGHVLNISPVGMIEEGSQMNTMRGYVDEILETVTFSTGESHTGTLEDLIVEADASNVTAGTFTKAIDRGDTTNVTWTLTIDTWGDGDIDNVAFHLSVPEPMNAVNFRLIGGTLMEWSNQPADTSDFTYYTKDLDFGNASQGKKVSKVYVTFRSVSSKDAADDIAISTPSNVLARMNYKTFDGEYTVDFNAAKSKNYHATTGLTAEVDTGSFTTAKLVPNKTDINTVPEAKTIPNKILSAQLVLYTSEGKKTPGGFEISDITISYRESTLK